MIARREHPEQPGKYVYVPLRKMETGFWVPLGGERVFFYQAFDAGIMCATDLRRRYVDVAKQARILRALCEHPQFAFTGEGVDADMVRERARDLSRLISAELENVARLLSEPRDEDDIVIGGMGYEVDEEEELIEPRPGDHRRWPPPGSPDTTAPMPEMPQMPQTPQTHEMSKMLELEGEPEPELLLYTAHSYLGMADQILGDVGSFAEALRDRAVAAPAEPEIALYDSPGLALWAARSYIRVAQRAIKNAASSVNLLRKQMAATVKAAAATKDEPPVEDEASSTDEADET